MKFYYEIYMFPKNKKYMNCIIFERLYQFEIVKIPVLKYYVQCYHYGLIFGLFYKFYSVIFSVIILL